jgi:hypothetical protein
MNAFGETLSEKGCSRNSSTIGSQHSTRMATIGVSSQAKAQKPIKKSFFYFLYIDDRAMIFSNDMEGRLGSMNNTSLHSLCKIQPRNAHWTQ